MATLQVPSPSPAKWEEADDRFLQRCVFLSIWGPESGGKTTLALTAPGPTALLHAAEKISGVYQPFVKRGQKVRLFNFGFTASSDEAETAMRARAVWANWKSLYLDAFTKWAKSIVLDTEPDAWALRRFAKFGSLQPKGDTRDLYSSVNFDWRQLLKSRFREQIMGRKCNLITIHTATDEYKDVVKKNKAGQQVKESQKTGREKMVGMKEVKYWADVIVYCYKDIMGDGAYHIRIDKAWFNGSVEGTDLTSEIMAGMDYGQHPVTKSYLHFASLMAFITDTPEAEWSK